MADKIKVLYVDDEVHNLQSFKATFRRTFDVFVAESGAEGLKVFQEAAFVTAYAYLMHAKYGHEE